MPSSYTISLRLTLQATGENNNTWGAILNSGVFGLVDYAVAGRLTFALSGTKNLTTALGATDEARAAFLDISGGSGGQVILPGVSKGYFVRNAAAGDVETTAGGTPSFTFGPGDILPIFTDGAAVYSLQLRGKGLWQFITDADQAIIDYINIVISGGSIALPPATGNVGKALIVRNIGAPPVDAWVPDFIQTSDVQGLDAAFVAAEELAVAFALTL
jgi:hypothetical protein